ncbi:hypothetical protein [Paenibacillus wynnii]|uniref:hypothetical protein n=1 Tax=Paenibacillus wynnii TaxID=268407 RepID=UPI0012FC0D2A|nr:hypothetical protein [Paenibacillus wynnii]
MIERPTETIAWLDAPWFTGDPVASLEVQIKAIEVDARKFALCLYVVRVKTKTGVNIKPSDIANWPHLSINIVADLLTATPRERAEAAYMVLSQVNE